MRLLVVSHTPHYHDTDGVIVGWGPTVRELDHLSRLVDELVHVAPLHDAPRDGAPRDGAPRDGAPRDGAPPASSLAYASPRVRLAPIRPAGGRGPLAKAGILLHAPAALATVAREEAMADLVHVRAPASIALLTLWRRSAGRSRDLPWWVKYAGTWRPTVVDYRSYRLQRRWLQRPRRRLAVTVNGRWPGDPDHVVPFHNPCLTAAELAAGRRAAAVRAAPSATATRLLFVGHLLPEKGALRAIEALARCRVAAHLDLVGDGPERAACEAAAERLGVAARVTFHGWLPRPALAARYAEAHLLLAPTTSSEGWPKVLSEAMAAGVVPIAGDVSCIAAELRAGGCGVALAPLDVAAFADAVDSYALDADSGESPAGESSRWRRESQAALEAARPAGYDAWLDAVRHMVREHLGVALDPPVEAFA